MGDLIWLTDAQTKRMGPHFPLSHGVPRVDDRKVVSLRGPSALGSCSLSRTACAAATRRRRTVRMRPCTTASFARAG